MDTPTENQTSALKGKSKLQGVLIALIFILAIFIIACLSLTVFLIVNRGPVQPAPMVLYHPSDETVPAGATRGDLEQAKKLAKDWTASAFKGLFRGGPQDPSSESMEHLDAMGQMLATGRVAAIDNGTHCLLVDSRWNICQVQVTEGPYYGQTYWVYRNCLSSAGDMNAEPGAFCGFVCASVYLRFLLTAGICCAGVYLLKLKSVLLQVTLFIIGMLLLNLLWIRLALLLMF